MEHHAAFAEFGGDLFYCDSSDDTVEGATAFDRRYAEQRESEKVKELIEPPVANATKREDCSAKEVQLICDK